MSKITVLLLCYTTVNLSNTGSQVYNDRLIHHLSKIEDINLHILTIGDNNSTVTHDNVTYHIVKKAYTLPNFLILPYLMYEIRRRIIEINPDLLHVMSTTLFYSTVATTFTNKIPTVLTAYGIYSKEKNLCFKEYNHLQRILSFFRVLNERYLFSKIHNIVVDTTSIKELTREWTDSKIYVVPGALEFEELERLSENRSKDDVDLFFVNNLIYLKGTDILIKAIGLVKEVFPEVSLYIAGKGFQKDALEELMKNLNLGANIKFLGYISDEEKYQYYKSCKIVVVPSRWDCQPVALFEAAAFSKPVIASDSSNPEIVIDNETGLVFKSEDVENLSEDIIYLLKNKPIRDEMGKKAREKILMYNWNNISRKYVDVYLNSIDDFNKEGI